MVNKDAFWIARIQEFRCQAIKRKMKGMTKQTLSDSLGQDFLLDLLQGIFMENVSEFVKIQMVFLVQEQSNELIGTLEKAEQVIGSLQSFISGNGDKQGEYFVSQLLITVTQVMIEYDIMQSNLGVFQGFVGAVLDIVCKVNSPHQAMVRKIGIECLRELELVYPGVLADTLHMVYGCCKQEKSFAFQSYYVLLCDILKHQLESPGVQLEVITKDAQQIVSFLLGEAIQVSPLALCYIMQQAEFFIDKVKLSQVMYNTLIMHCSRTFETALIHAALNLQEKCTQIPGKYLKPTYFFGKLRRIMGMSQLPTGIRLSCQRWLLDLNERLIKLGLSPQESSFVILPHLYPIVFDGTDVLRGKYEAICKTLKNVQLKDTLVTNVLETLTPLLKPVEHGLGGNHAAVLFRIIYMLIFHDSGTVLSEKAYHLVYILNAKHPKFACNTIDLLDSLKEIIESRVYFPLVRDLVDLALSLTDKEFARNMKYHLLLLDRAARETELLPLEILIRLKKLCCNKHISLYDKWDAGNCIIRICRAVLSCHTSEQIIFGVADLLWTISQSFEDDDIKDRALLLYLTIGYVSPVKYQSMFVLANDIGKRLDIKAVEGDIPSVNMKPTRTLSGKTAEHLLLLRDLSQSDHENQTECCYACTVIDDPLTDYYSLLTQHDFPKNIVLAYRIRFADTAFNGDFPAELYAVTLQFKPDGNFEDLADVNIPYIRKFDRDGNLHQGEKFLLTLTPKFPIPGSIQTRAVFTDVDGRTCILPLKPLTVDFRDLFCPIPVPSYENKVDSIEFRSTIFDILWAKIENEQHSRDNSNKQCALSVKCIHKNENEMRRLLERNLAPFRVKLADDTNRIAVWLPPHFHVLMKFQLNSLDCLVWTATDDWHLLETIELYLEHIGYDE